MKVLFLILLILPTLYCLTSEQAKKFITLSFKECLFDPTKKRNDLNATEKCRVTFTKDFDCIPEIKINQTHYQPCANLYFYDTDYVPMRCFSNGTLEKIDYSKYCKRLSGYLHNKERNRRLLKFNITTLDLVLRSDALQHHQVNYLNMETYLRFMDCAVCFASLLFLIIVPFKNVRVMLHRHLILTFFLNDILEIVQVNYLYKGELAKECTIVHYFNMYFYLAQVCWMFNEGFFQFRQFFFVFITKSYLWLYFLFGWGLPLLVVFSVYVPIMQAYPPVEDYRVCWRVYNEYKYNYIVYTPVFLLLLLNMLITVYLMWLIWSKLKHGTNSNEMVDSRKAARGFLMLMFVLGGSSIFTLYGPDDCIDYQYIKSIMKPSQGIFVCIAQVFASKEVWGIIRRKSKRFVHVNVFRFQSMRSSSKKRVVTDTTENRRQSPSTMSVAQKSHFEKRTVNDESYFVNTHVISNSPPLCTLKEGFEEMNNAEDSDDKNGTLNHGYLSSTVDLSMDKTDRN